MEIADRFVGHFLRFPENGVGLLVGLPDNAVPLFVELLLPLLRAGFQVFGLAPEGFDLSLFFFNGPAALFQVAEQVFKRDVLFA